MSSTLASTLWLSGPSADAVLLGTLLGKYRWRQFPAFTCAIAVDAVWVTSLFFIDPSTRSHTYTYAFISGSVLSFILQIAILVEVARHVLRQPYKWSRGALKLLAVFGVLGAIAALSATLVANRADISKWPAILDDIQLFSGLLTCEVVIAISLSAGQLGLPLRSHVLAIGQGLAAWSLLAGAVYGLETVIHPKEFAFQLMEVFRALIYPFTVLYWTVSLWHEEPARRPISPALRKYIVALHDQVQYDLGKVGH